MHKECLSVLMPVRDTLDIIGGKWKLLILISIWEGNKHFREIERSIPKLSTKVLAKELKELEMNKLINRTIKDGFPVRIEYTITPHTKSLQKVITELRSWGLIHRKEIFGEWFLSGSYWQEILLSIPVAIDHFRAHYKTSLENDI